MKLTEFFAHQTVVRAEPLNVEAAQRSLTALIAAREPRRQTRATLLAELPKVDPEMPESGQEQEERQRVLADVEVLERGNWLAGYSDARLRQFDGGPGLSHLDYWIKQAEEAIAGESALRAMTWPSPFRYTGRPGTTRIDGRMLRRGDVVNLSRAQFEAFADKFSPADAEQPSEAATS